MIAECLVAEFNVTGDECPLGRASAAAGVEIHAQPPQLRSDGNVLLSFSGPLNDALSAALDGDDDIRYLHVTHNGEVSNYRCLSKRRCVVHELVDEGFLVDTIRYRNGGAVMRGAVVGYDVLRGVMETAARTVGVRLGQVYPIRTADEEPTTHGWTLTPRQREGVEAALEAGYFSIPREATAEEVATELDISKSAFLERIRRAQRAVFEDMFS